MKKSLICGIASLALAAAPALSTFATGLGSQTQDIMAGEVDETIYSVDISWGDMTFDWKYDYSANTFGFATKFVCSEIGIGAAPGEEPVDPMSVFDDLFQDDACTEPAAAPYSGPFYARLLSLGTIDVDDSSVNGRIKARASFSPEDDYSWVTGRFSSVLYVDNDGNFSQDLDDGYLEATAGGPSYRHLNGVFYLEGDNAHVTSDAVHAGDKIGTVTLTIEPDLN